MSTLEVNSIAPLSSSSDVTLGGSSKNVKFASGTTVDFSTNTPTLTLGSAMKSTPFFEAYPSSDTSIASSTVVKVPANTEKFDSDGCYDNSTNYRFTPTTAGKYFCYMSYSYNIVAGNVGLVAEIKKNGTAVLSGKYGASSNSSDNYLNNTVSGIIDFNGTSDYIEMFTNTSSGITRTLSGDSQRTFFGAYRIIA